LTSEQLVQARAERMRQTGLGTLTLEDARTWIEETGLCLFLPKRQFGSSVAPSFVEAVAGRPEATPDPKTIAIAEELLIRLENEGVAVRLNLSGQPGEQPDFVVAGWVLPYVYALRGDRDWRRSPQLTGSRQVSQLAVHVYKLLEGNELTVSQLKQALGREVSEAGVIRAITELWQQLRIIPVIAARGQAAKWQLLRVRFQRAIAEGASTSQVTAISVLASIYLQAVIAGSMEDVEMFLQPLTARSKIREVIRGLVATRQVHTISLGHAPHFYVAGTLPEFEPVSTIYASSAMSGAYFSRFEDERPSPAISIPFAQKMPVFAPTLKPAPVPEVHPEQTNKPSEPPVSRASSNGATNGAGKTAEHFRRPASNGHEHKSNGSNRSRASQNGRTVRRSSEVRSNSARPKSSGRPSTEGRWAAKNGNGKHSEKHGSNGTRSSSGARSGSAHRKGKSTASSWDKRSASAKPKSAGSRKNARPAHKSRPALAASGRAAASTGKRFFSNRGKSRTGHGTKKRG
jgi:23S rRNA pseudouridine2605 synthase